MDLSVLEASLDYMANSRLARATEWDPASNNKTHQKKPAAAQKEAQGHWTAALRA